MGSFKSMLSSLLLKMSASLDRKARRIGKISRGARSYSQCGEDLIAGFVFDAIGKRKGVFLDIGASDPTELNNTLYFYERGWRGWNVDPIAANIASFDLRRPGDHNICAGIGTETHDRMFYRIDPSTLSTFDEENARLYEAKGHPVVERRMVPFLSVADLFERNGIPREIDLLSLDVEGGEAAILDAMFASGVFPTVVILETVAYGRTLGEVRKLGDLVDRVTAQGYAVHADTFVNTIFVRREIYREN